MLKNKKVLITILSGALVTAAIIGAQTFAWFTDRAEADVDGVFWTAKVGVDADGGEFNAYDFYPGAAYEYTRQFQGILEGYITEPDSWTQAAEFQTRMKSLYDGHFADPLRVPLTAMEVPTTIDPYGVYLIQNPFNKSLHNDGAWNNVYNVTAGSILEAKYNFDVRKGGSTIPVYFKISKAELYDSNTSLLVDDIDYVSTAVVNIIGTDDDATEVVNMFGPLVDGDNGFLYCPIPLSPRFGWRVEVINLAYIFGDTNDELAQGRMIKFAGEDNGAIAVDLIQATNNAVYFHDDWTVAADKFVPYVEADLYGVYLQDWTGRYPEIQ